MSTQPRRIPQATSPAPALMPNQARSWLRRGWKKLLAATFLCGAFSAGLRTDRGGRDGYSVDIDPASRHYFCVRRCGKYIHADYDLLDIIDADDPRTNEIIRGFLDARRTITIRASRKSNPPLTRERMLP
jgi:hypothetical protein